MPKLCFIDIDLDRNKLVLSATKKDTGATMAITRSGDSVDRINALSDDFRKLVVMRSFALENDPTIIDQARALGGELYDLFIAGFEELLDGCSSIVFRHKQYFLPPELAFDGKHFLGMRYAIGNWIERFGDMIASKQSKKGERALRLLFLGPERDSVWQALQKGRRQWRCDAITKTASDPLLRRLRSEDYDILHFACHGRYNEAEPDLAFWILDDSLPATDQTSVLHCAQLKSVPLRHQPLVFLNACQSGIVTKDYRGFIGFTDALFQAGALNCITTLWSITDQGAGSFAAEFYKKISEGKSIGESMREARLACWITEEAPLTSLSYILFGDPERTFTPRERFGEEISSLED